MFRTVIAGTILLAILASPLGVSATTAIRSAQSAPVSAADAAPFVGDWTLALQGANGPGEFDLSVKVQNDKVVGTIAGREMASQTISDITKADKTLLLRFSFDYQGNAVDAVVSLTPATEGKVTAQIDFAGGAYVMTGTAAKKEKTPQGV